MEKSLKKHLQNSLLVGDGAMATYLYQQGAPVGHCTEEIVLSNPKLIAQVHLEYYQAGARLIETHTYGANRERLTRYGLENKVTRLNREAVHVARQSVPNDAFVVGTIGSICAGRVSHYDEDLYGDLYEEQAIALLHAGVDGLLLETFLDLKEALIAVDVIRPLTDLPIILQLSMIGVGRTRDAYTLSEAFQLLAEHGVDGIGLNCRQGPVEMLRNLEKVIVPENLLLSAFPNAGRLGMNEGKLNYPSSPLHFKETAQLLVDQGIRLIGGCCGTTPAHIANLSEAIQSLTPVNRVNPAEDVWKTTHHPPIQVKRSRPTIVEKVKKERTIICEWDPPRDLDISQFLLGAERLHQVGVDSITMADNSLATARMSNLALGAIVKSQLGVDPLLHVACRDRNLLGQQSHLMGLHALGIDQILVITGDPTRMGDLPGANSIYDVTSIEFIHMVKELNKGISFSGKNLNQSAQFVVGAAFNPHVRQMEAAVQRLSKKVEAGADFVMTQPVYDSKKLIEVYEATKEIEIPTFIGVMPLTGERNALYLHNEVPGIKIPQEVLQRMEHKHGEEGRKEGIIIAKELLDLAMEKFHGIYLITPFSFYEMTEELTQYIRQKDQKRMKEVI
ncbi:bifunctional homocysteine S-methyltransferase/methylenetetrahydrofolate reductase [Hazenella coriacea]|uniref:Homocysteine S-methyltransferase n=1 Tax=Hazenella coriacea TaxID=1179467 RepID=A0A4R3L848_9BACL|nr:bifunctional homocysteine S-methyltransferase/methylenetetrahydrofolate reductase [Hazenella coriacea]TCS95819.1 homocysteine S-methyltransferase [Hazenella coriacea]